MARTNQKTGLPTGNLGTRAGPIINSGGRIAGDPNSPLTQFAFGSKNPAVVSDYSKYYGTYSGSDIKVVVHHPPDYLSQKQQADEIRDTENDAAELVAWYNDNQATITAQEQLDYINTLQAFNDKLIALHAALKEIQAQPTSKTLGEIQTISISSYRDKAPVRPLGAVYPRGYTRGPRTISGSMIFTIFHQHVFYEIMKLNLRQYSTGSSDFDSQVYTTMLPDQLPPLDISLVFANEYGAISHMGLWGVEFFQEAQTFSIQDIYSENTVQYIARDMDPLRVVGRREVDGQGVSKSWSKTATDLMNEQRFDATIKRRNPFI